jgi:hypothetical protein
LRREFPGQGAENTAETCQQGATGAQILRVDLANTGTPSMRRLAVGSRASEQTSRRRPRCHPLPPPATPVLVLSQLLRGFCCHLPHPGRVCGVEVVSAASARSYAVLSTHSRWWTASASTATCLVQFGAQRHALRQRGAPIAFSWRDMHNSCMLPVRVRFTRPWRDEGWV